MNPLNNLPGPRRLCNRFGHILAPANPRSPTRLTMTSSRPPLHDEREESLRRRGSAVRPWDRWERVRHWRGVRPRSEAAARRSQAAAPRSQAAANLADRKSVV